MQHPLYVPAFGNLSTSIVEPIDAFAKAHTAGELASYQDLVMSRYVRP
jgi:hypothetical protein